MAQKYDYLVKILMVGDSSVGKTSMLLRFSDDCFNTMFVGTIGVDFRNRIIDKDGDRIKLQIWDTAGQERFRTITTSYYRGAQAVVLVYDISNESSFNNIKLWMHNIQEHAPSDVYKILVGNKCDMVNMRQVTERAGKKFAHSNGMKFLETSAKDGCNVNELFYMAAKDVVEKYKVAELKSSKLNGQCKCGRKKNITLTGQCSCSKKRAARKLCSFL